MQWVTVHDEFEGKFVLTRIDKSELWFVNEPDRPPSIFRWINWRRRLWRAVICRGGDFRRWRNYYEPTGQYYVDGKICDERPEF